MTQPILPDQGRVFRFFLTEKNQQRFRDFLPDPWLMD